MFFFKTKPKILEVALPFQGELVHLLEEPLPKGIRSTLWYCITLVVVAFLVSVLFRVDVVVNGSGKLTYDSPPIILQPYERAILKTLTVRPGDIVKKGQLLATLDPTFIQADLSALSERRRTVHAQVRRLEAEVYGRPYQPDPADGLTGELQRQIHAERAVEYEQRLRAHTASVEEHEAGLNRLQKQKEVLEQQLEISTSIEGIQENLLRSKTKSQLEFLGAKSARLRAEKEHREAVDGIVEKRHQLETARAQKEGFVQEWRRNLLEELTRQRAEEAQADAALSKSSRIGSFENIVAPEDGVVVDIANRSAGSVLRDAEPLVILAPSSAPLMCQIELGSGDVGQIAINDPVIVKVDAFPFQRYGGLEGRVRSISHESHAPGAAPVDLESVANKRAVGGGLHRVTVELISTQIPELKGSRKIIPGMTVSGEVHVGKRLLIQYLLDPILRGLRESFREA